MASVASIWNRFRCLSAFALTAACVIAQSAHVALVDGTFRFEDWHGGTEPPVLAGDSRTPMLGTYSVERGTLIFHPRFPVAPGTTYRGDYRGAIFAIEVPLLQAAATRIEQVYPSADSLPANTLKLYLCFSAPMSIGDAAKHFRFLDERGQPIPDTFLDQELWDREHTRLTVLLDPGRIKRGLAPNRDAGSPIVDGRLYTLSIDRDWHDARGLELAEGFQKHFAAVSAVRTVPGPETWRLEVPKAGTRDALRVRFPRPMDYALLQTMVTVAGVAGEIGIGANETEWSFTPAAPWHAGTYSLTADPTLEDIAGNHLDRPFDVDLRVPNRAASKTIELPFRIPPR
jgi:hypothetical protein